MIDGHSSGHVDCPACAPRSRLGRRGFLGLLGLGAVAAAAGYEGGSRLGTSPRPATDRSATPTAASGGGEASPGFLRPGTLTPPSTVAGAEVTLGEIPAPHPGPPRTIFRALEPTHQIALTIDDGFCAPCAQAYVEFAEHTGLRITFSPNGIYSAIWNPMATRLQSLIATGQVQIGNHTYTHANLLALSDRAIGAELERNDEWIQQQFGITARPWFRPPYGLHDARTDDVAGGMGFTHVLMWDGSFGDSTPITPDEILALARQYLKPGTVMLGHANRTTIVPLLPEIYDLIAERGLEPATLDEMFGTSRATG